LTGILTEMQAEQDTVQFVVIGIGININQSKDEIPEEVQKKATSLYIETKKEWNIVTIIQEILSLFEKKYELYLKDGFHPVKQTWENYGFRMNEELEIKTGLHTWKGIFLGIAEDGALLAKKQDGTIEKVYSGEISWF